MTIKNVAFFMQDIFCSSLHLLFSVLLQGRKTRSMHKQGLKPSALSPKAWKHKLASTSQTRSSASPFKEPDVPNSPSSNIEAPVATAGKKRRRPHTGGSLKKKKRSSVESHTVSVQRLSGPLFEESSTSDHRDTPPCSDKEPSLPPTSPETHVSIKEQPLPVADNVKRPRTLRVSLSIPGEVEPGTPLDKVVSKANGSTPSTVIQTTPASNLPSWDEIASTTYGPKSAQQALSPLWVTSVAKTSTPLAAPLKHQSVSPNDKPTDELSPPATKRASGKKRKFEATIGKEQPTLAGTPSPPDDVFESMDSSSDSVAINTSTNTTTSSGTPQPIIGAADASTAKVTSRPKVISLAGTVGSPVVTSSSAVPVVAMLASPLPTTPVSKALEHVASPALPSPVQPGVLVGSSSSGRSFTEPPQVGYKAESKPTNQETVTPGFTQGQHLSKVVVSTITMPGATRQHSPGSQVVGSELGHPSQVQQSSGSSQTPVSRSSQTPVSGSSQTPVSQPAQVKVVGTAATKVVSPGRASLVPNAMSTALPTKGRLNNGQSPVQPPMETAANRADADVIITGVERKEGHVLTLSSAPTLSHSSQPPRPHILRPGDSRPKKVIAKTVVKH